MSDMHTHQAHHYGGGRHEDQRRDASYHPTYRPGFGPPPRKGRSFRGFLGDNMSRIVFSVISVVGGTVAVATWHPAEMQVCTRIEIPTCPPDLQEGALGQWIFVRYDPDRPNYQSGEMIAVPRSLAFFDDGDYVTVVEMQLAGTSADQRETGSYEVKYQGNGWARLRLSDSSGTEFRGVILIEFTSRELRVTDESGDGFIGVYRRE
jgi:hypothetical protein